MTRRIALCAFAALGAASLLTSSLRAQDPARRTVGELAGRYEIVDMAAATRRRDAAIDDVVGRMNFLVRGIARRRLKAGTPIHRRIRIDAVGDELRVRIGDAYDFRAPPDGTPRRFVDGFGNELRGKMTQQGDRLRLVFRGDSAVVHHTLTRTDGGLGFALRIHSDRLPADVTYRARYRRVR